MTIPFSWFQILIYATVAMTIASPLILLILLHNDHKRGTLW